MKEVKLPLMSMSTSLDAALSNLRKSKRAALLSEHNGKYRLFRAEHIVIGRSQGIKTLSELTAHAPFRPEIVITHVTAPVKKTLGKSIGSRSGVSRAKKRAATAATRTAANFYVGQIVGNSAFLSVRSMNLADKFVASPSDCYCDGPRH